MCDYGTCRTCAASVSGNSTFSNIPARPSVAGEVRRVERVTLTRIVVTRGDGKDTVFREVTYLFDDDGRCVSHIDPCANDSGDEKRAHCGCAFHAGHMECALYADDCVGCDHA